MAWPSCLPPTTADSRLVSTMASMASILGASRGTMKAGALFLQMTNKRVRSLPHIAYLPVVTPRASLASPQPPLSATMAPQPTSSLEMAPSEYRDDLSLPLRTAANDQIALKKLRVQLHNHKRRLANDFGPDQTHLPAADEVKSLYAQDGNSRATDRQRKNKLVIRTKPVDGNDMSDTTVPTSSGPTSKLAQSPMLADQTKIEPTIDDDDDDICSSSDDDPDDAMDEDTYVNLDSPGVQALATLIQSLLDGSDAADFADGGQIIRPRQRSWEAETRDIEIFDVSGVSVTRIQFLDVDVSDVSTYRSNNLATKFEMNITRCLLQQTVLGEDEYLLAAYILLARAGDIGGSVDEYFQRALDLGDQQALANPSLRPLLREAFEYFGGRHSDLALEKAFFIVKQAANDTALYRRDIRRTNQSQDANRSMLASENELFFEVEPGEIILVLDKNHNVIALQCCDAFKLLLKSQVQDVVTDVIDKYSNFLPPALPDKDDQALHWLIWLRDRPDLDSRRPENTPNTAKSGVYTFGVMCDTTGRPQKTDDSSSRHQPPDFRSAHAILQKGALTTCTDLTAFFFRLIDEPLYAQYLKVARQVKLSGVGGHPTPRLTWHENDSFTSRMLSVNTMVYAQQHDELAWPQGFTGRITVGEYEGGDVLLRQLGLRLHNPPGSVLLHRNELKHTLTAYKGRRFQVAHTTQQPIRDWACRKMD